jgi:hypothetical protein
LLGELFDKRSVGVEIIANHDLRHLGMFPPQAGDEPLCGCQFTILGGALWGGVPDFFHLKGQHLMRARAYQRGPSL